MKYYFYLALAIVCELFGTSFLQSTDRFTKLFPSLLVIIGVGFSFFFLSKAIQVIPIGIAYAIWSGVGIVFLSIFGAIVYNQKPDFPAVLGIVLILAGVIIINVFSKTIAH